MSNVIRVVRVIMFVCSEAILQPTVSARHYVVRMEKTGSIIEFTRLLKDSL